MQERDNGKASDIAVGTPLNPDNVNTFLDGSNRSVMALRSAVVGLGTYKAGWRWSLHAGAQTGKPSENHIGYIFSGRMMVQDSSGVEKKVGPGDAFEVGPRHDARVIGGEPCTALDFTAIGE